MTTDTKVADLPAKWRAWAKRIRGITAGSDLAADIMDGAAEDLEAALARQDDDAFVDDPCPPSAPVGLECTCSAKDVTFGRCCKAARLQEPVAWYYGFADTGEAGPVTFGGNPGAEAVEWARRHGHELHYLYAAPPAAQADEQAEIDRKVGKLWREDSSLETWFPITAEELKRFREAQAVDLEQFREAVEYWLNTGGGGRFDVTKDEATRIIPEAQRLLSIIDQQAGKGVVP